MASQTSLDRTDFGIVRLLMADAHASNKQLAAAVGLAPSSCHERIKALRAHGVLLGSHAEVNFQALGLAVEALLFVQVAKLDRQQVDDLVDEIASVREVRSVFLISGRFDLIVHLVVRDMEQLKTVISEQFNRHACVLRVESSVVFNRRERHAMPIADDGR
jgi:DNA-binding Lrp family transcriptional regulator